MEPTRWWEAANERSRQNAGSATWPHQAAWDEVATRGEPEKELSGLSADLKDGGPRMAPRSRRLHLARMREVTRPELKAKPGLCSGDTSKDPQRVSGRETPRSSGSVPQWGGRGGFIKPRPLCGEAAELMRSRFWCFVLSLRDPLCRPGHPSALSTNYDLTIWHVVISCVLKINRHRKSAVLGPQTN